MFSPSHWEGPRISYICHEHAPYDLYAPTRGEMLEIL